MHGIPGFVRLGQPVLVPTLLNFLLNQCDQRFIITCRGKHSLGVLIR